ncbi:MAG: membrane protein insertion efficiency factor YidD [candidate division WOR-3 bacterium]
MRNLIILIIKTVRLFSNLFPPSCRFYPTCSYYAEEAVKKYGIFKGLLLSLWRVLRCNPFSKGGINYPEEDLKIIFRK